MIRTVEIVSLSSGIIGEKDVAHEVAIGVERLKALGLEARFSEHALKGLDYIRDHPEARAADLLRAFADPGVDMILSAIGGDDTYRLLPYLFGNGELKRAARGKVFLGFSDTTVNHLMLHKVGVRSFYGQAFLPDLCELAGDMLPYTRRYFEELIRTGTIREIRPSDLWYEERTSFGPDQVGTPRKAHPNVGFELLQGAPVFSGPILGGCIDTLYDLFDNGRYADSVEMCAAYGLFPPPGDWKGRILLLETSEEKPTPGLYEKMLLKLKDYGLFGAVAGVLAGKPMDETYAEEYKRILVRTIGDPALPVVWNLNVGHAAPRCIVPFGVPATVDVEEQVIRFG